MFLAGPQGPFSVFPARARAGQFGASAERLTFLVDSSSFSVSNRFLLSPGPKGSRLLRICCDP